MSIFSYMILALIIGVFGFFMVFTARLFIDLSKPAGWPKTRGRVVTSDVESLDSGPSNDITSKSIRTCPHIVYRYEVRGTSYECDRITLGRAPRRNYQIPGMLLRYPVGATVQVRYDPADPSNAVVQFDSRFRLTCGFLLTNSLLLLMGLFFYGFFFGFPQEILTSASGLITKAHDAAASRIIRHFPRARAGLVIEAGGLGLMLASVGLVCLWQVLVRRSWPVTRGRVIYSQIEIADTEAPYRPDVIYGYEVDNRHFQSNRISTNTMASGLPRHARKVARRYPRGSAVDVHYNPKNHAESVLKTGGLGSILFLLLGGGFLWIAISALG